jgi:hypothetical protein
VLLDRKLGCLRVRSLWGLHRRDELSSRSIGEKGVTSGDHLVKQSLQRWPGHGATEHSSLDCEKRTALTAFYPSSFCRGRSPICRRCQSIDIPRDEFAGRGARTAVLDPGAAAWLVQSTKQTRRLEESSVKWWLIYNPNRFVSELHSSFRSESEKRKLAEPASAQVRNRLSVPQNGLCALQKPAWPGFGGGFRPPQSGFCTPQKPVRVAFAGFESYPQNHRDIIVAGAWTSW